MSIEGPRFQTHHTPCVHKPLQPHAHVRSPSVLATHLRWSLPAPFLPTFTRAKHLLLESKPIQQSSPRKVWRPRGSHLSQWGTQHIFGSDMWAGSITRELIPTAGSEVHQSETISVSVSLDVRNPHFKLSVITDFPGKPRRLSPKPLHKDFLSFLETIQSGAKAPLPFRHTDINLHPHVQPFRCCFQPLGSECVTEGALRGPCIWSPCVSL